MTCLACGEFDSYEGEYSQLLQGSFPAVFSEMPNKQCNFIQNISFYSVHKRDEYIIFEIPQLDFVILRHIFQNNLVKHDLYNVIRMI